MPAYSFEALTADGVVHKGVLEADTARAARSLLRAQELVPLNVEPVGVAPEGRAVSSGFFSRRVFSAVDLTVWTRQMAGLVGCGLPLEQALTAVVSEASDERQRHLLAALRAEVNAGASFAAVLAQHPREFAPVYVAVIEAGEQSGDLGQVLNRLADDLEAHQALVNRLVSAAVYPAIVSVVAVLIVIFLLSYVVPQVAQVFAASKATLPLLTRLMLMTSEFFRHFGWAILALLAALVVAGRWVLRGEAARMRLDAWLLRLPLIGRVFQGYNAARFAATLGMLSSAGVPVLRALQAAAQTLPNTAMRADAQDALVMVREGAPLATALAQKKRFPPLLSMFARLGEQTGALPQMLQRAAEQLGSEVSRRAMRLATMLEPLLILGMGALVLMIVLSVMLPIIQMNQLVR